MLRSYTIKKAAELRPFSSNSRIHSDEQIQQVCDSISEYKFTNPILIDENDTILAGHCRVLAAQKLGMDDVPCVIINDLTDTQKRAYVIADNKMALNADWDLPMLKSELEALNDLNFDVDLTGFSVDEIAGLFTPPAIDGLTDEDLVPEDAPNPIIKRGDIWVLGDHRLMCGDSATTYDVSRLMNGNQADLIFTDPPYGIAFQAGTRKEKFDVLENDDLSEADYTRWITGVCEIIDYLKAPYYVWCSYKFYGVMQKLLMPITCIVWAKNHFGLGSGYKHQHEFCLTNSKIDDDVKDESDLWNIAKDTNYMHPTQKPVALAERALSNHKSAKNVVDLFGGSGTTLIACEKLNKKCYMMEISEKYCDIIIQRYEKFSGKKATQET